MPRSPRTPLHGLVAVGRRAEGLERTGSGAMDLLIDIQRAVEADDLPDDAQLTRWVEAALRGERAEAELGVRLVDARESRELNHRFRGKDKPTNVLSFRADLPPELELPLLGDLIICADVVRREAASQAKAVEAHWAHMVVHGTLHLLGYDHERSADAGEMEARETAILAALGYPNPYE